MSLSFIFIFQVLDWSKFPNDVIPKHLQRQCTLILPANSSQQINILSRVCRCAKLTFLGQLTDVILIILIYLSTVSHQARNMKQLFWVEKDYITLPFQIYSSYLCDYLANLVKNIPTLFNVIKNFVVCLLFKSSYFHFKYNL